MVNLKELMMILELHRQGLPISAIAQRAGHVRKTVRKYIQRGLEVPHYKPRTPRAALLDPYRDYLRSRLSEWPELSGQRLLREIRALGYSGGKTILNVAEAIERLQSSNADLLISVQKHSSVRLLTRLWMIKILNF
ncbi:hypothetical protein D9M69_381210 [compost metagenome]